MVKKFYFKNHELTVFESVYEPGVDSIQLAKRVSVKKDVRALDRGCGCGIQAINMALQGAKVIAVDINPIALENSRVNAENGFKG